MNARVKPRDCLGTDSRTFGLPHQASEKQDKIIIKQAKNCLKKDRDQR
jgi:hypothetical protein